MSFMPGKGFVVGEPSVEHPKVALAHNAAELETLGAHELTAGEQLANAGIALSAALTALRQALDHMGIYQPGVEQAYSAHKPVEQGLKDLAPKVETNLRRSPRPDAHDAERRVAAEVDPAAKDTRTLSELVILGKDVVGAIKTVIKKIEDAGAVNNANKTAEGLKERGGGVKKAAATLAETARDW